MVNTNQIRYQQITIEKLMNYIEVLPTLKALNHKDKIRAIQFLANEVVEEEDSIFVNNQEHNFVSQTDSFEASRMLQKLLDEHNANAIT